MANVFASLPEERKIPIRLSICLREMPCSLAPAFINSRRSILPVFFHAGFCSIYWEYISRTRGIRCSPKPQNQDITLKEPLKESLEKLLWNSYSTLRGHPMIELYSTPIHLQNPYGSPANTLRPGAGACSHPSSPWQTCTRKECPLKV